MPPHDELLPPVPFGKCRDTTFAFGLFRCQNRDLGNISRDPSKTDDGGWYRRLTRVLLEVPWSTRPTCDLGSSRPCEVHARHLFTPPARMASAVALRDSKMLSGSGEGSARCIQCVQGSSGGRRGGVGVAGEGPHMSHGRPRTSPSTRNNSPAPTIVS